MKWESFFMVMFRYRSMTVALFCLLLQGCSVWTGNKGRIDDELMPQSTVIALSNDTEDLSVKHSEVSYLSSIANENNFPSTPSIRALPRRPEIEETVEEDIEDEDVSDVMPELEPNTIEQPKFTMYVVQRGDTLSKISHQFHVAVDQIVQENALKNRNRLSIGQVLVIPEGDSSAVTLSPSSDFYVVKKGDTLSGIAARYRTTIAHLKLINKLTSDKIYQGQKLKISEGSLNATQPTIKADMTPITGDKYTVKTGDSLWTIARRSGLTIKQLKEINHLHSDILIVGKVLFLRTTEPSYSEPKLEVSSEPAPSISSQMLDIDSMNSTKNQDGSSILGEEDFEDLIDAGDDIPVSITPNESYAK